MESTRSPSLGRGTERLHPALRSLRDGTGPPSSREGDLPRPGGDGHPTLADHPPARGPLLGHPGSYGAAQGRGGRNLLPQGAQVCHRLRGPGPGTRHLGHGGKGKAVLARFAAYLTSRGVAPSVITDFTLDMSEAFIQGIGENFPQARLTFDKIPVIKMMNEAVDQVRREERRGAEELTGSRYLWLYNPESLRPSRRRPCPPCLPQRTPARPNGPTP